MEKTALIVEDKAITSLDLKYILKKYGFSSSIVYSGKKAIAFIEQKHPSLALLDIKLADDISGIEVAKKLKEKQIPFIFISAFSDPNNYKLAKELKPSGIVRKPLINDQLSQLIGDIFHNLHL